MERVPQAMKQAGGVTDPGKILNTGDLGESHHSCVFMDKKVVGIISGIFSHKPLIYTMYIHVLFYPFCIARV